MAGWYKSEKWDGTHNYCVNVETQGGAKLMQGRRTWDIVYGSLSVGIDTHIVFGINDIIGLVKMPDDPKLDLTFDQLIDGKVKTFMSLGSTLRANTGVDTA